MAALVLCIYDTLYHSRRNDRDRDCECDRGSVREKIVTGVVTVRLASSLSAASRLTIISKHPQISCGIGVRCGCSEQWAQSCNIYEKWPGPALANRRPCSTPLLLPVPPYSSSFFLFLSFPFPSLPCRHEAAPLKPARASGGVPAAVSICCIVCFQKASGCSINICVCAIILTSKLF